MASRQISPWNMVERGVEISDSVAVADLPRVAQLATAAEPLTLWMSGRKTMDGRALLSLKLSGDIQLSCERCLQSMPFSLQCESELTLRTPVQAAVAANELELTDNCDELVVERGDKLSTLSLVEDEILLALPLVVRHGDINDCGPEVARMLNEQPGLPAEPEEVKQKPFANLADLLSKRD